jgi:pyroglutamyl-peptidase
MAKKLLITGFDPFGGASINPAWEAVKLLPDTIGEYELHKLEIPTVYDLAGRTVLEKAQELSPDLILCIGQAGGRAAVTPERIGVNIRDARISDNAGNRPQGEFVAPEGPAAYFSTIPARKIADAVKASGVPSKLSYSAGAYVCNDLLYTLLSHYRDTDTRICFIHIPYCKEQGKEPSMELPDIVRALEIAIKSID